MKINKQNLPLILAFAMPLLLIIAVALSVYLPALQAHPMYDFIFYSGYPSYNDGSYYVDSSGTLQIKQPPANPNYYYNYPQNVFGAPIVPPPAPAPIKSIANTQLYYFSTAANSSRQITLDEAQKYVLNTNSQSPDGFMVQRGTSGGGIFPLFYSNDDYNNVYLDGHKAHIKLNINSAGYYNFNFLGWVNK